MEDKSTEKKQASQLMVLGASQLLLLLTLVVVVAQLWRTQRVPAPIINVQPTQERIVSEAYVSIPRSLNEVSARVRTASGAGSAVALSPTMAVTNFHVIKGTTSTVWLDTAGGPIVFDVFATDEARDLALLRAPANFKFKRWAKLHEKDMEWGDQVIAVGCANNHLPIPTVGHWIRVDGSKAMLSISCFWGSSGCGVFDAKTGELAGIMVQWDHPVEREGATVYPSIFYCIPQNLVKDFMDKCTQPKAELIELSPPKIPTTQNPFVSPLFSEHAPEQKIPEPQASPKK